MVGKRGAKRGSEAIKTSKIAEAATATKFVVEPTTALKATTIVPPCVNKPTTLETK